MKIIYKYPLDVINTQILEIPCNAEILTCQVQKNVPCIWAKVNPDNMKEKRIIKIYGTGHSIYEHKLKYISTIQLENGNLVFHVFEQLGSR